MNRSNFGIIVLLGCILGSFAIMPYGFIALGKVPAITLWFVLRHLLSNLVIYSIAIFVGFTCADMMGLKVDIPDNLWNKVLQPGVIGGLFVGGSILLAELTIFKGVAPKVVAQPGALVGLLASLYGAINEEVLLRLFTVSGLSVLLSKLGAAKDTAIGSAILVSAVLFGMVHLPLAAQLMPLTVPVILRTIALNGIAGIIFGWLYWRYSLITAMWAHFVADILLHGVVPLLGLS